MSITTTPSKHVTYPPSKGSQLLSLHTTVAQRFSAPCTSHQLINDMTREPTTRPPVIPSPKAVPQSLASTQPPHIQVGINPKRECTKGCQQTIPNHQQLHYGDYLYATDRCDAITALSPSTLRIATHTPPFGDHCHIRHYTALYRIEPLAIADIPAARTDMHQAGTLAQCRDFDATVVPHDNRTRRSLLTP